MKEQLVTKRCFVVFLGNVVLVLMGLTLAMGMAEMLMRAFPSLIPSEVRVNPPARRVRALINETYALKQSDGDLFHYMHGKIKPLSPEKDRVLAQVHMMTDLNGFRNSPPEKNTYDIVALGDSFTRASGIAIPWPQKLDQITGLDVINLGEVGFGPQDELKVLQQYGLEKKPQWVIMAYFEGNDLNDAAAYELANPFISLRFGRYILEQSLEFWHDRQPSRSQGSEDADYVYPITITIDKKDLEIAFFSYYISWLSVNSETIEASQNYRIVKDTILKVSELSEASEARLLLVYVPSKEHIYLPYVTHTDSLTRVFSDVPSIELDGSGFLQFNNKRSTPELTLLHMNDQSDLLAKFAKDHKIAFLDLTSIYQEEASEGAELYYPFDTHSNQKGHDLAAAAIYEYIRAH